MHTLQIALFARLTIRRGDAPIAHLPAKVEELLCYLLLRHEQPHTREELACELWPDAPAAQSKKYLRQCLWQLQHLLEPPETREISLLRLDHEWVALHPQAALQVDVLEFEQAFAAIRGRPGAALDAADAEAAEAAIALYQGELLGGWYQDWCLVERVRYESLFTAMLDKLIAYCMAHGLFDQGIAYSMRQLRNDHAREQTHRQLMRLYALAGDRTAALRQFERCAATVAQEFGVTPAAETLTLRAQICDGQLAAADQPRQTPDPLALLLADLANLRGAIAQLQREVAQLKQANRSG